MGELIFQLLPPNVWPLVTFPLKFHLPFGLFLTSIWFTSESLMIIQRFLSILFDFLLQILEMKLEEKRGLKDRASSDSDLLKKRNTTTSNTKDVLKKVKVIVNLHRMIIFKRIGMNFRDLLSSYHWRSFPLGFAIQLWCNYKCWYQILRS